ncbi:mandelate racemase/muconate lactonizing enzyme family protein [Nocardioides dilutus]
MRITGYRTLTTVHDWGRPVGDANGVFHDGLVAVPMVLVDTDEGITGVGLGPHLGLSSLFTALDGEDPRATVALYDRMLHHVFKAGHGGALFGTIGALDSALWDIKAKAAGQPLWRLLGGRDRVVPAYASGLDIALSEDELAEVYRTYAERGLRVAKLKGGLDVGEDLSRLTLVREVLAEGNPGSRPGLMIDANESWTGKQAVRHVAELERAVDLIWVEEPVRRWDASGMVAVGRGVRASVASGENLTGLEQYRPLLAAGALDVVQTASGWGVTHFLRVAALAHAHDLPVSPIGTTPIGLVHAATAVPNHIATELQDLSPPTGLSVDVHVEGGRFVLGESPGLGVTVDEEAIALVDPPDIVPLRTGPHIRPAHAGRRLDFEPS